MHNYSFGTRKKIWNENVQRKFCQESSNLPFAIPGNVKLKLPYDIVPQAAMIKSQDQSNLKFNYFFFNDHSLGRTCYPQCTAVVENIQNIYELKTLTAWVTLGKSQTSFVLRCRKTMWDAANIRFEYLAIIGGGRHHAQKHV
jgi:hypothetical protein